MSISVTLMNKHTEKGSPCSSTNSRIENVRMKDMFRTSRSRLFILQKQLIYTIE